MRSWIVNRGVLLLWGATSAALALEASPPIHWARAAGGQDSDVAYAVAADASGNVHVTGAYTTNISFGGVVLTNSGLTDLFVAKYDNAGSLVWVRRAGGPSYDEGRGIAVDAAGNVIVTGLFQGTAAFGTSNVVSTGQSDVFLAKYDAAGNLVWVKRAGGNDFDEGHALAVDAGGNIYLTGTFDRSATFGNLPQLMNNTGVSDIFIAKADPAGSFLWSVKAGGSEEDDGRAITVDAATNIMITGFFAGTATFGNISLSSTGPDGLRDIFIAKYSDAGSIVWAQKAGGAGDDEGHAVAADGSGNVLVTGHFLDAASFSTANIMGNGQDIFLAKYSSGGGILWARNAGGNDLIYGDSGRALRVDTNGNAYVSGYFSGLGSFGGTNLSSSGFDDIFVAKYDSNGSVIWVQKAGGNNIDIGHALALAGEDQAFVGGSFYSTAAFGGTNLTSFGFDDAFLFKIAPSLPPLLSILKTSDNVALSWPATAAGYVLETTGDPLNTTNWVTQPTTTNGITLPISDLQRFFRLRKL